MLEDLHSLIGTLQQRIADHGSALKQSEALTRYALIDPLLRGLGWDTGDPAQVLPEYRSAAGTADYALLGQSTKPQVIIEAKKLDTQLDLKVRRQVTGYCQESGIPYAVITDGQHWEIYDVFKPAAMAESVIVKLDLMELPAKTCLDALALWHPGVAKGTVTAGRDSVFERTEPEPAMTTLTEEPVVLGTDWHRLVDLKDVKGKKPTSVRLPDGQSPQISTFVELNLRVLAWLTESGRLSASHLPIRRPRSRSRFIVATSPKHPTGKPFVNLKMVNLLYVEMNFSATDQVKNCKEIIRHVGLDPADFAVKLR